MVDVFACATLDFLATDGELKHDTTVLALFFADFRRGHLVDGLASGALHLLRSGDELQHRAAVVTNEMGAGHGRDTCCNRQLSIGQVDEQVLVLGSDLVAH